MDEEAERARAELGQSSVRFEPVESTCEVPLPCSTKKQRIWVAFAWPGDYPDEPPTVTVRVEDKPGGQKPLKGGAERSLECAMRMLVPPELRALCK